MRILEKLRRVPTRYTALAAIAFAVVTVPAVLFAWGPTRPTYTMQTPADHVTFNSITNNPEVGDERNFVGIREAGSTSTWSDSMKVQAGKSYTVRVYVHNNAATNLNASGKGIARDVTASVNLPTTTAKSIQVDGTISASNASPKQVWDDAVFTGDQNFNLSYVKGSLKYENNAFGAAGTALPESIFTSSGAKLGYDKLDGTIPGCLQYAGYISFTVKPQFAQTASFTMSKLVSKHGANSWVDSYAAQPAETVDYLVQYKNTGDVQQNGVVVKDQLPAGTSYVAGSTVLGNSVNPSGIKTNDGITTSGLNIGSYAKNGNAWLIYSAKIATQDKLPCGPQKLTNTATVETDYGTKSDTADVTVNGATCRPPVVPVYTCDSLSVQKLSDTSVRFSTAYTIRNATFKGITYVVRNNQGTELYRGSNANYTQTVAGTYTVQAYVVVTVNGEDKTVTSDACKKSFTIVAKNITVCELATKKIVTIKETDFDASKYSKNLDDCKTVTPKMITVCELDTKKIITIDEKDFDSSKYSKNLNDCKTVAPKKITVCNISTKQTVTINESDFDASKYTKDLSVCAPVVTPPVVTPTELPKTGAADIFAKLTGVISLAGATAYYVASRRNG